jgi:hypothetical protein
MREICTSGSTRGEWVVLTLCIAHSPTLPVNKSERLTTAFRDGPVCRVPQKLHAHPCEGHIVRLGR